MYCGIMKRIPHRDIKVCIDASYAPVPTMMASGDATREVWTHLELYRRKNYGHVVNPNSECLVGT